MSLPEKSTYKLRFSYGPTTIVARTAACLLDTCARGNTFYVSLIPEKFHDPAIRNNLPPRRTATKQPRPLDGLSHLHLRLGDLNSLIRFGMVSKLAVDAMLGTSFIDRFRQSVLPSNKNIYHCTLIPLPYLE